MGGGGNVERCGGGGGDWQLVHTATTPHPSLPPPARDMNAAEILRYISASITSSDFLWEPKLDLRAEPHEQVNTHALPASANVSFTHRHGSWLMHWIFQK